MERYRSMIPKVIPPTCEPTDIIKMICKDCGRTYTRKSGLMIKGKLSKSEGALVVKPCVGIPGGEMLLRIDDPEKMTQEQMNSIAEKVTGERCGGVDYEIWRENKINAMPIGRRNIDLSRKHS